MNKKVTTSLPTRPVIHSNLFRTSDARVGTRIHRYIKKKDQGMNRCNEKPYKSEIETFIQKYQGHCVSKKLSEITTPFPILLCAFAVILF